MGRDIRFADSQIVVTDASTGVDTPEYGVEEITTYPSRISHDQLGRGAFEIFLEDLHGDKEERLAKMEKSLRGFARRGHTSTLYQAQIGLDGKTSRLGTLALCFDPWTKYVQQSLRYTQAGGKDQERPITFYPSPIVLDSDWAKELTQIYSQIADFYTKVVNANIPPEDARFILPLDVGATNIHTNGNFTSYTGWQAAYLDNPNAPQIVKNLVTKLFGELQSRYPRLFSDENVAAFVAHQKHFPLRHPFGDDSFVDDLTYENPELAYLDEAINPKLVQSAIEGNMRAKSVLLMSHNGGNLQGYLVPMSIAAQHQLIRQDTVPQAPESYGHAAERGIIITPPTIAESEFNSEFQDLANRLLNDYYEMTEGGIPPQEAIGILPHALQVREFITVDGWNTLFGFMKDRLGKAAQWEIRDRIARPIAQDISRRNPAYSEALEEMMSR